ncbi:MAG TPA: four helix bundle protein [Cytophagaceae bacterium]
MFKITTKSNEQIIDKTFEFSLKLIELYIFLIKNNEFELSEKLLKSGTSIRENLEQTFAAGNKQDFILKLAQASKDAVETRYWLKLIQMKHMVNSCCDDCVEKLNEIIAMLSYLEQKKTNFRLSNIHLN